MTDNVEKTITEVLGRGVGEMIDPDGSFRDKLLKKARGEYNQDIVVKFGVDPNRPDIHLGHAVAFRKLRQLQDLGCKIIFLIGDFTALIGDPTGKSKVRPEVDFKAVEHNANSFIEQVDSILKVERESDKRIKESAQFSWIRNSDWFIDITDIIVDTDIKYTSNKGEVVFPKNSFPAKAVVYDKSRMQVSDLKRGGSHNITLKNFLSILRKLTHGRLIARDMFQERLKAGEELYLHEMMYPVLQAIDSHVLAKIYGSCDLELGGTDQTFNMLLGRDVMKMNQQDPQAVMSVELLVGTDGKEKMSKSLDNYIAITDEPDQMFGKIMSVPDDLIVSYFELCTYTPLDEVEKIKKQLASDKTNPRDLKIELAKQIVEIYYGKDKAQKAELNFTETFSKGGTPETLPEIKAKTGSLLSEVLVGEKLVSSKSEWRRLVDEGAVTDLGSNKKITDQNIILNESLKLKIGKHRFVEIVL